MELGDEHIRKVVDRARFATRETSGSLNLNAATRSIVVGRRTAGEDGPSGLMGKAIEASSGQSILDYSVWLDLAFPHVIGVFGTRGTGKSFTLGVLTECVAQLEGVTSGKSPSAAIVLLDVQNQFWTVKYTPRTDLLEDAAHLKDIEKWGLSPASLSEVVVWAPCRVDRHLREARVFRISPDQLRVEDWLAVLEQERYSPMGQALVELLRKADDHRPAALASYARAEVLPGFQAGTVDGLRWRLEAVGEMGLIGENGTDVRELLRAGQMSVVLLRNLPNNMRALTAGVLARLLAGYMSDHHQSRRVARRRGESYGGSRLPDRLWLALDEAHLVVPSEGGTPASEPLIDYVKRGRDCGLSLIFATQQPSAVDRRLMSQADITLTHSLCFDADIQAAAKRMPADATHGYERDGRPIQALGGVIRALGGRSNSCGLGEREDLPGSGATEIDGARGKHTRKGEWIHMLKDWTACAKEVAKSLARYDGKTTYAKLGRIVGVGMSPVFEMNSSCYVAELVAGLKEEGVGRVAAHAHVGHATLLGFLDRIVAHGGALQAGLLTRMDSTSRVSLSPLGRVLRASNVVDRADFGKFVITGALLDNDFDMYGLLLKCAMRTDGCFDSAFFGRQFS